MEYYCSYCKDEEWVHTHGGLLDSPCPMNCTERKAIEEQEFSKNTRKVPKSATKLKKLLRY